MSELHLQHDSGHSVAVLAGDRLLLRYVYQPTTDLTESPRPYLHPVNSLQGDTLTNFRPNDHPWHHALSLTLNQVSGVNFWGGPTCARADGYQWRNDHGLQRHQDWKRLEAAGSRATLAHTVAWIRLEKTYFQEERNLVVDVDESAGSWSLQWSSRLVNVSGQALSLGNPHSQGGMEGSHYSGLQFRGARELLDDHLDPLIKVVAEGGIEGIKAVHGVPARWMEWHGQLDETLRRVVIRFENNTGPLPWFVRRNYPLAAFPVEFDRNRDVPADGVIELNHTLTFTCVP